jgi:hypothetical protein
MVDAGNYFFLVAAETGVGIHIVKIHKDSPTSYEEFVIISGIEEAIGPAPLYNDHGLFFCTYDPVFYTGKLWKVDLVGNVSSFKSDYNFVTFKDGMGSLWVSSFDLTGLNGLLLQIDYNLNPINQFLIGPYYWGTDLYFENQTMWWIGLDLSWNRKSILLNKRFSENSKDFEYQGIY